MIDLSEAMRCVPNPVAVEDPGAPYLLVDLYPFDLGENPPWEAAFRNDNLRGAILKATDGVQYGWTEWFRRNFKQLTTMFAPNRGSTMFFGGYHYLQFNQPGRAQADFYLKTLKSGGWGLSDIMPIVDVEFGGERSANRQASTQQIIDVTTAFAERCKAETGRRVMLYGRGAMRDREIRSRMGCDVAWNPSYTPRMIVNGLVEVGGRPGPWQLDDLVLWQYGGDGVGNPSVHRLPLEIVGFGKIDMNVVINGAHKVTIEDVRAKLL